MKELVSTVTIAVPVVNEMTNDGIITALQLEDIVICGMTYGAWFKIGMGIALALLIVERALSIRNKLASRREGDDD